MKKTTKRMIISVLTLVLTVAALGTTTFAWFSLSTTSQISNISGNVTGGEGLEVKLVRTGGTSSGWMANINAADLANFYPENFKFEAVTTADPKASSFKMMQQSEEGFITLDGVAVANRHYLEFDIQLRSQTPGIVNLTGLEFPDKTNPQVTFAIDGNAYEQYDNSGANTNYIVLTRAKNGARVSISQLDKNSVQVSGNTQVYQNGDSTLTNADGALRYDGSNIIGNHVMLDSGVVHFGQWSYLTDSRGLRIFKDAFGTELLENLTEIEILDAHTDVTDSADPTSYRTTINLLEGGVGGSGYYSASFRVRIWIEGWDADSYDSIYRALLSVNFTFQKPNLTGDELLDYSALLLDDILESFDYIEGNNALPQTVASLPVTYEIGDVADPEIFTPLATPFNLDAGTYNLRATITGDAGTTPLKVVQQIVVPLP